MLVGRYNWDPLVIGLVIGVVVIPTLIILYIVYAREVKKERARLQARAEKELNAEKGRDSASPSP